MNYPDNSFLVRKIKKIHNQRKDNWSLVLPEYPGKYCFPAFGIGVFDKMCLVCDFLHRITNFNKLIYETEKESQT